MFKMPSVCSNASCKTWTPLPDRFTDEHLVENVPTLGLGVISAGQRHESGCDTHAPAASPKSGLLGNVVMNFSHCILSPASTL